MLIRNANAICTVPLGLFLVIQYFATTCALSWRAPYFRDYEYPELQLLLTAKEEANDAKDEENKNSELTFKPVKGGFSDVHNTVYDPLSPKKTVESKIRPWMKSKYEEGTNSPKVQSLKSKLNNFKLRINNEVENKLEEVKLSGNSIQTPASITEDLNTNPGQNRLAYNKVPKKKENSREGERKRSLKGNSDEAEEKIPYRELLQNHHHSLTANKNIANNKNENHVHLQKNVYSNRGGSRNLFAEQHNEEDSNVVSKVNIESNEASSANLVHNSFEEEFLERNQVLLNRKTANNEPRKRNHSKQFNGRSSKRATLHENTDILISDKIPSDYICSISGHGEGSQQKGMDAPNLIHQKEEGFNSMEDTKHLRMFDNNIHPVQSVEGPKGLANNNIYRVQPVEGPKGLANNIHRVQSEEGPKGLASNNIHRIQSLEGQKGLANNNIHRVKSVEGPKGLANNNILRAQSEEGQKGLANNTIQRVQSQEGPEGLANNNIHRVQSVEGPKGLANNNIHRVQYEEGPEGLANNNIHRVQSQEGTKGLANNNIQRVQSQEEPEGLVPSVEPGITDHKEHQVSSAENSAHASDRDIESKPTIKLLTPSPTPSKRDNSYLMMNSTSSNETVPLTYPIPETNNLIPPKSTKDRAVSSDIVARAPIKLLAQPEKKAGKSLANSLPLPEQRNPLQHVEAEPTKPKLQELKEDSGKNDIRDSSPQLSINTASKHSIDQEHNKNMNESISEPGVVLMKSSSKTEDESQKHVLLKKSLNVYKANKSQEEFWLSASPQETYRNSGFHEDGFYSLTNNDAPSAKLSALLFKVKDKRNLMNMIKPKKMNRTSIGVKRSIGDGGTVYDHYDYYSNPKSPQTQQDYEYEDDDEYGPDVENYKACPKADTSKRYRPDLKQRRHKEDDSDEYYFYLDQPNYSGQNKLKNNRSDVALVSKYYDNLFAHPMTIDDPELEVIHNSHEIKNNLHHKKLSNAPKRRKMKNSDIFKRNRHKELYSEEERKLMHPGRFYKSNQDNGKFMKSNPHYLRTLTNENVMLVNNENEKNSNIAAEK